MADKICSEGTSYKLYSSNQPQMICGCPSEVRGDVTFVLQTFGGERRRTRTYKATTELLESHDFIGLNPQGEYDSASYQGTNYTNNQGQIVLAGQENFLPEYIDESEIPGFDSLIGD